MKKLIKAVVDWAYSSQHEMLSWVQENTRHRDWLDEVHRDRELRLEQHAAWLDECRKVHERNEQHQAAIKEQNEILMGMLRHMRND